MTVSVIDLPMISGVDITAILCFHGPALVLRHVCVRMLIWYEAWGFVVLIAVIGIYELHV
jgi:hypothetical protein